MRSGCRRSSDHGRWALRRCALPSSDEWIVKVAAQHSPKKGAKGSQLEANKKAMNIKCKVCMQTFICTTSK
ncbi:hypothetical protein LWI28_013254 [Acer negundo]|uniref:Uncharacterized protein n=1 Tax=Acer negundo TaxID=4023 RepID=A0AAD5IQZ5_ACENE|nr:hypothetical protein LWI28_013254 [Acer negundo]